MTFATSIQALVGDHSGGVSIAFDWARNRAFMLNNTHLSRYGVLTGEEEAYAPLADMGGVDEDGVSNYTGIAANGNIFLSASGSLYNGAAMYVNGSTLTMINLIGYSIPNEGGGGMIGVTHGSTQYCVDKGLGDSIIGTLNRIQEISTTARLANQDYAHVGGVGCAGPVGTGVAYILSAPDGGGSQVGPAILSKILFDGSGFVSNTEIDDIAMVDIDAGWTDQFHPIGVCLDQTDGKLLAVFSATGGSNSHSALVKIDPVDASIEWIRHIPNSDGGGRVSVGETFAYSDIRNQRIGFYTGSPATITIINTSDGSIATNYSNNLGGMSNIDGQCYNDTLGAIALGLNFTSSPGHPVLLNGSPSSWSDGYALLYVDSPVINPDGPSWVDVTIALSRRRL